MSLTEVSYYFRKFLPITIITCVFLIMTYFTIRVYLAYLDSQTVAPIYINPLFSKLPMLQVINPNNPAIKPISFPPDAHFTIDTIEGRPITATAAAKIFFLPQATTKFGYLQNAYTIAKNFGIDTEQVQYQLNDQTISFNAPDRILHVTITNFNFDYKYNYEKNPQLFDSTMIPEQTQIEEKAKQVLRTAGRYPEELAQGTDTVTLFHYDTSTQQFVKVDTSAKANVVEVDFFRPAVDNFPSFTTNTPYSQNYVIMTFKSIDDMTVLKSQIKFFEKENQNYGVYPVKTGDQAFEDLKNKKAFIVSSGNGSTDINIKKMSFGYFDPDFYESYLQPVYVFIGEGGFTAYVPAISDSYVGTSP